MAVRRDTGSMENTLPKEHKKKVGKGTIKVTKTPANEGLAEDDPKYALGAKPMSQSRGEWKGHSYNDPDLGHGIEADWHEAGVPGNATHATPAQSFANSDFTDVWGKIGRGISKGASASEGRSLKNRRNRNG